VTFTLNIMCRVT